MNEQKKEAADIFLDEMRKRKLQKFLDVGFTQAQSELLIEQLGAAGGGFGFF